MTSTMEPFTRHTDSVLCCSIDSNSRLAVSGGIDDTAFVWDLNTKHVIFECLGHKESVVAAAFSANSTYVATGDLNGYIQVRNTTTGIKVFDFYIDEINWILWHNISEYVLIAGTTKGDFWVWNVNDPAAVKTFASYGRRTTAARLLADGIKIVVSYSDGSLRVFDLKTRQTIFQLNDAANQSEIICLDLNPSKTLVAVGCMNSTVKLITLSNFKIIGTLACKSPESTSKADGSTEGANHTETNDQGSSTGNKDDVEIETEDADVDDDDDQPPADAEAVEVIDDFTNADDMPGEEDVDDEDIESDDEMDPMNPDEASVESVSFSPCGRFLAGANVYGTIVIWDVGTLVTRCEIHTNIGVTRASWSESGLLVTGCLDGAIRIYDNNLNKVRDEQLHKDQILDVACKGNLIVSASEDKTCQTMKIGE